MKNKHDKSCELGDNWKGCPACQETHISNKHKPVYQLVPKNPPDILSLLFCTACGRNNLVNRLKTRHFVNGKLCAGTIVGLTYKLQ